MLSFFPEMYPDELLYSVIARYHKFSGNLEMEDSALELFGHSTIFNSVVLPRRLGNLISRTESYGISFEEVLYNRTLFPLLTAFEADQKINIIKAWALDDSKYGSNVERKKWGRFGSFYLNLRICPVCLEEEKTTLGEGYWHRLHQVPGVLVCIKHKKMLYDSNCYTNNQCVYSCPEHTARFPLSPFKQMNNEEMDTAVKLSVGIQWLFDNFATTHGLWTKCSMGYREVYLYLLEKKGFVTKNGTVLISQWQRDFFRYYGKIYSLLDLCSSNHSDYFWESEIFLEPPQNIHPLQHFLMMQYLSGSIGGFFDQLQYFEMVQPNSIFSSRPKPYKFDRKAKINRNIWMNNFELFFVDKKVYWRTLRAYSWLYEYDHDWLVENAGTNLNIDEINKKDKKYNNYKGAAALQFNTSQISIRISKTLLRRFKKSLVFLNNKSQFIPLNGNVMRRLLKYMNHAKKEKCYQWQPKHAQKESMITWLDERVGNIG